MVENHARYIERTDPDMRPLGALALGVAILGAVLWVTYFLSPLAAASATLIWI